MGTKPITSPAPDTIASAFRLALDAARQFEGATAPNPPVGCAILDTRGAVLAVAAHSKAGEGHAEAEAIALCQAQGLVEAIHTIVVTLEPCNHWGRTPPCAETIANTPALQVWIGARDPNPIAGGGAARLREMGRDIGFIADLDHADAPDLAASALRLIAPFAKHVRARRPWLTIKQVLDAKGSMIPPPGQKTFAAKASLLLAHGLRRRADAILTGSGTILADAPLFTVRHLPDFAGKTRRLVILDRRNRVPPDYLEAARQRGLVPHIATSLPDTLDHLGRANALEVLVEAGPQLTEAILLTEHWDEHILIQARPDGMDHVEMRLRTPISPFTIERT